MNDLWNMTMYILSGSGVTLKLFLITIVASIPLGVVCALLKITPSKIVNGLLDIYTWVFRGTPLLLQLFFMYFALPTLGIRLERFDAAALTFVLNYGAYFTEIFRGGIQSVAQGQYEAAKSLGLNYTQTMRKVVLPQALKRCLPATSNEAITLVKDTALVTAIGIGDMLRASKEIVTREFNATGFIIAGIIYLLLTSVIVIVFKKLEKKYAHFA